MEHLKATLSPCLGGEVRPASRRDEGISGLNGGIPRVVFSMPVALAFMLLLLVVWSTKKRFNDPDLWWHLKVGETIWQSHSLPQSDQFSFTTNNHPWIAHEWLAELSIYSFYWLGGEQALQLWLVIFASAVILSVYLLCFLVTANPKVAMLGALIAWFFATIGLAIRPLILGHLFLVFELILLHLGQTRNSRWLWGLPLLFVLWINCHGSFVLGFLVLGIVAFCSRIHFEVGLLTSKSWKGGTRDVLLWVILATAMVCLLNPIGIELVVYPFNLMLTQSDNIGNITEWRALTFTHARAYGVLAALFFVAGLMALRQQKLDLQELLLLLLGTALALRYSRMLFAFGILAAPLLARLLASFWSSYERKRDLLPVNAGVIAVSIILIFAGFPSKQELKNLVNKGSPVDAVAFIRNQALVGNLLNDYQWGGYLIWALPEKKVFIDGRADIFDWTGVLREYVQWMSLEKDPRDLIEKYDIRHVLLKADAPHIQVLRYLPGWREAYSDDVATIFSKEPQVTQSRPALSGG